MTAKDLYGTETVDLINSRPTEVVPLADGDVFDLGIGPVVKRLGDAAVVSGVSGRLRLRDPGTGGGRCLSHPEPLVDAA